MVLYPINDNQTAQEDIEYNEHYWMSGWYNSTWSFTSNATWLKWNLTLKNIMGTPDNGDVGWYWVNITISCGFDYIDVHNFTLTVNNTPPKIESNDVTMAFEDLDYTVDYNSTDDGQGSISWSLNTDTGDWLSINQTTGVLQGQPFNEDVGQYSVNITIDDGNGGADWSNFLLTVINTNDLPRILNEDNNTAYEDLLYQVQYEAEDVDFGDTITWDFKTNASDWLSMDLNTGILSGIPGNDEVGTYWVNVTIKDVQESIDFHYFILTVINVNDPPIILTDNIENTYEDKEYYVDYNFSDIDVLDKEFEWAFKTNATWLNFTTETGELFGTPGNEDVGDYFVNISIRDSSDGVVFNNFTLQVINVNDDPIWIDAPKNMIINLTDNYYFDVNAIDIDLKDTMSYGIQSIPSSSISIDSSTGVIQWSPENVGTYTITVNATDGVGIISHEFRLLVVFPVEVVLISPQDNSTLDILTPILKWNITPYYDKVTFDIYLTEEALSIENLDPSFRIAEEITTNQYGPLQPLEGGTSYNWTIIPRIESNYGSCSNGIWAFSISKNASMNHPPEFISTPPLEAGVDEEWTYEPQAIDQDEGDTVTIILLKGSHGMEFDNGVIKWTPTNNQIGNHSIKVIATDGIFETYQEFIITVSIEGPSNYMPIISPIALVVVTEGKTISIQVEAIDVDNDNLTYYIFKGPRDMQITESGYLTWKTKEGDKGKYQVIIQVSDGNLTASKSFEVIVKEHKEEVDITSIMVSISVIIIIIFITLTAILFRRRKK